MVHGILIGIMEANSQQWKAACSSVRLSMRCQSIEWSWVLLTHVYLFPETYVPYVPAYVGTCMGTLCRYVGDYLIGHQGAWESKECSVLFARNGHD